MPYLTAADRRKDGLFSPGKLNYHIIRLCLSYLEERGECYQTHNDILGVLEAVKCEWYRRLVAPYEERKRAENGDVYPEREGG